MGPSHDGRQSSLVLDFPDQSWTALDSTRQHSSMVSNIDGIEPRPDRVESFADLLMEIERLRVSAARGRGKARMSLQDIATASGVPKSSVANYLSGSTLLPRDQLDAIILGLGATAAESAAWGRAWERAMERQLKPPQREVVLAPPRADAEAAGEHTAPRRTGLRRRLVAVAVVSVAVAAALASAYVMWPGPDPQDRPSLRSGCQPVTGSWDGQANGGRSVTVGVACKQGAGVSWTVANRLASIDVPATGGFGNYDWCLPVTGDWDADGTSTVGVACGGGPEHRIRWSLINGYAGTPSYPRFYLGDSDTCWPVTGDWDGDGSTTAGAACAEDGRIRWELINAHSEGAPTYAPFTFGDSDSCRPVTGDWNGDRRTTVGVACHDRVGMRWALRDTLGSGPPSLAFTFGEDAGCLPVTGDWNGDSRTSVGVVCRVGGNLRWTLTDTNRSTDYQPFDFGAAAMYSTSAGWAGPAWPD